MDLDSSTTGNRAQASTELETAHQLFPSVWQRVIPEEQLCPVVIPTPAAQPPKAPTQAQTAQLPSLVPAQARADTGPAFPARSAVPFFGSGSADFSTLLQELLLRERASAKLCRSLSRRTSGVAARALSQLCAEHLRSMRRLAAAHFLITGVQPNIEATGLVELGAYLHCLREQFIELQQLATLYAAASIEARDPWLRRLFQALGEERMAQAARICALVEQS